MKMFPSTGDRPIYKRWWFWVGLVILVLGTAYGLRVVTWNAQYESDHAEEFARGMAAQLFDYQAKQLEKQYREDTYGGDTPEETLRMFVEALEKKDFALAAKYYVPEKQTAVLKLMTNEDGAATNGFVDAYKSGVLKGAASTDGKDYQIDVTPKGDTVSFYVQFRKNPFSNKWKITEPS